jgi:hypothetical protein
MICFNNTKPSHGKTATAANAAPRMRRRRAAAWGLVTKYNTFSVQFVVGEAFFFLRQG